MDDLQDTYDKMRDMLRTRLETNLPRQGTHLTFEQIDEQKELNFQETAMAYCLDNNFSGLLETSNEV